jgi:hypothetical protein
MIGVNWSYFVDEPSAAVTTTLGILGRAYPATWERSNRPDVVAHLERLLATVATAPTVEIVRDPDGVLSPPPPPFWAQTGEVA